MIAPSKPPFVGMAQIAVLESPQTAVAVLGSCVGLAIFDPRAGLATLAHIVLPTREGREGPAGKFVDSAIPDMIASLIKLGADRTKLKAKAAGGASMFNSAGPIQVGAANAEAVARMLKACNIPLLAADLGGSKGRRITFDCASSQLNVEIAGIPSQTL